MKKNKNDNLYKFSRDNPWQFCFVVILYLIGASGIPNGLFGFVTGTGMNGQFVSQVIVKLICCILPVWLITEIKGTKIFCLKGYFKSFLFIIPFLLVAVNNFPIFSVLSGDAIFTDNLTILNWILYIFAILCGVLVEELCFRGLVFPVLLRRFSGKQNGCFLAVLISSSLFGVVHIVNLLAGASIVSVLMQIGYSLLIGGMCAISFLKTGNFYHAVFLHFIFNIGGLLLDNKMINGNIWTTTEIVITAVLGVIVFVYALLILFLHKKENIMEKIAIIEDKNLSDENN